MRVLREAAISTDSTTLEGEWQGSNVTACKTLSGSAGAAMRASLLYMMLPNPDSQESEKLLHALQEAAAEMNLVLARATKALAVSPGNRVLLLDASVLEPLLLLIASPSKSLSRHATQVNLANTWHFGPQGPPELLQQSADLQCWPDLRSAAVFKVVLNFSMNSCLCQNAEGTVLYVQIL